MTSAQQAHNANPKHKHQQLCHPSMQVFKKPDPKELVRKWQADLRTEQRKIDRQIRGVVDQPLLHNS